MRLACGNAAQELLRPGARKFQYRVVATDRFHYRSRFGLSATETVEATQLAFETAITGLSVDPV